jgi:hypothetical protein
LISAPGFYAGDQVGGTHVFGTMFAQAVVYFGIGKQLIIEAGAERRVTVHQVRNRTYLRSKDF